MSTKKIVPTKKVVKAAPKKKGLVTKSIIALGAGVAAIGAATYYFFGPKGKKHQKDAREWMTHMEADVLKKLDRAQNATEKTYREIVDEVSEAYEKYGKAEVVLFAKKLKAQWKSVEKAVKKPIANTVKKIAKKASKKK